MPRPLLPEFRSDLPPDPDTLNRLADDSRVQDRALYRAAPDEARFPPNVPFDAEIVSNVGAYYSWFKICSLNGGADEQDGWGLQGTASAGGNTLAGRSIDGSTTIAAGTRVLMWFTDDLTETRFIAPSSASTFSLTAADDKGHSYTGRDKITINNSTVTDNGSGDSTYAIDNATDLQAGLISYNPFGRQQMGGGLKAFNGGAIEVESGTLSAGLHGGSSYLGKFSVVPLPGIFVADSGISTGDWTSLGLTFNVSAGRILLTKRDAAGAEGTLVQTHLALWDVANATTAVGITATGYKTVDIVGGVVTGGSSSLSITSSDVSDFTEAAQDAVGAALTDTSTINLTYDDAANTISADAIYQMSITADASGLKLSGDSASPGANQVYSTDGGGTKGWYSLPSGYTDEEAQDAVGTILVDSTTIDFTYSDATPSITADVIDDSISNAKLRNSGACSVIGRSANSTGDPADISAGSNDTLLIRTSNTLSFGQLTVGMVPDDLVTYAKIQNVSATQRVLARKTAGAGDVEECTTSEVLNFIASVADGDILYRTGGAWTRLAVGTRGQQIEVNGSTLPAWSGPHAARVYHSVNQTISNSTVTALALDSERFDTDSFHDTSTNNSRLTVPSGMGGKYLIGGSIQWDAATGGYRFLGLRLNGSTYLSVQSIAPNPTAATEQSLSTLYNLSAGDYVELIAFQNRGGNLNVNAAGNNSPEFWLVWMGP